MIIKKTLFTIALFLFSFNFISAQDNFEGKIKFKISHDDDEMFIDYYLKDENIRMEMGENNEAVFIKTSDKSILLMPSQKMYMDLDNSIFSKIAGMSNLLKDDKDEIENENIDIDKFRTGKTKTILGYECSQWIFKDEGDEEAVEAWVTNELGNFMLMKSPMGAGFSPGWSSSMKNNGFFPLLVITKDEDNNITSRFEATHISKESLSKELFRPPSNFDEMKIPGM